MEGHLDMKWCDLNHLGTELLTTAQLVYMQLGAEDQERYKQQIRDKLKQLEEVIQEMDDDTNQCSTSD